MLADECLDAPHGQIRDAWEGVATCLSTLKSFEPFRGIKGEACRKQYMQLMNQFRKDNENGEFKSGAGTGDSEELHRALADLMNDEDVRIEGKEATAAAKLGRETEQARRAELVRNEALVCAFCPGSWSYVFACDYVRGIVLSVVCMDTYIYIWYDLGYGTMLYMYVYWGCFPFVSYSGILPKTRRGFRAGYPVSIVSLCAWYMREKKMTRIRLRTCPRRQRF